MVVVVLMLASAAAVGYLVSRQADQREQPGPADAGAARSGAVIRQDELTLRAEDGAYLEQGMAGTAVPVTDLYFPTVSGPAVALAVAPQGVAVLAVLPGPAAFDDCKRALAARRDSFADLRRLGVGGWMCARTNEGNIAGIRVLSFSQTPQEVALAVTLWRG